ncbi:MAG: ATP-binding protein [Dehalococcoidia bacterium]|nr:MAG: ATP-binding protein [Dehalococcoidia bacterium]
MPFLYNETDSDVARLEETLGTLPQPVARPGFIVISGLPGTGKSHLASLLAKRLHYLVLESDRLRKVLFPRPSYQPGESARLFAAIHRLIETLLKKGISVILDATNLSERNREYLYSIADRAGAKLVIAAVEAPPETVKIRLTTRRKAPDGSEADWSVYQKMKAEVEKIGRHHLVVDTSQDTGPAIEKIARAAEGDHKK